MAAVTSAVIGGVTALAGTAMSFAQMGQAQSLQREAKSSAEKSMADARKALEINYMAQQGIKKEPYELEREAMLASGAQAIQAGAESERGAAATAGRVQLAMNEGQAGIRTAMGKELSDLEARQLQEQSRLRDVGVQLDLGSIEGAQQAQALGSAQEAQAMTNAMTGLTQVGGAIASSLPLFAKTAGARQTQKLVDYATKQGYSQEQIQNMIAAQGGSYAGLGYSKTGVDAQGKPIQGLSTQAQWTDAFSGMNKQQIKSQYGLFSNKYVAPPAVTSQQQTLIDSGGYYK